MRFINRFLGMVFVFSAIASGALFSSGPSIVKLGVSIQIRFGITEASDVEVAVINGNGKILRHLAAGVLGGTYPPPEPLRPGLDQDITWDGLDDYGHALQNGSYRIRVRLGVHPLFERSISTKVYPTGFSYYQGASANPLETYINLHHPLFLKDSTLYEEDFYLNIAVSDESDELLVMVERAQYSDLARFDGSTGRYLNQIRLRPPGGYMSFGEHFYSWDGERIYYHVGSLGGLLFQFDKEGRPLNYPGMDTNVITGFLANDQYTRGFACAPDSSLYIVHEGDGTGSNLDVSRIKNGITVRSRFMKFSTAIGGGIKADFKGNLFIAARVKPKDKKVPDFVNPDSLAGEWVPPTGVSKFSSQKWWADEMYGSLLKFSDSGGGAYRDAAAPYYGNVAGYRDYHRNYLLSSLRVDGALWMEYGYSHIMSHNSNGANGDANRGSPCWCSATRFDVDRFGRVFYPNTFQNEFVGIDNNRNPLFRLKNRDIPEVSIGCPHQIEVTDRAVYVADYFNNQVATFVLTADLDSSIDMEYTKDEQGSGFFFDFSLSAHPNPFNPRVSLDLRLNGPTDLDMAIHAPDGRLVKTLQRAKGASGLLRLEWDGRDNRGTIVGAGRYVAVVRMNGRLHFRELVLLK